mgnify:CR=1 FL=1
MHKNVQLFEHFVGDALTSIIVGELNEYLIKMVFHTKKLEDKSFQIQFPVLAKIPVLTKISSFDQNFQF